MTDGTVNCWGRDYMTASNMTTPAPVAGVEGASSVSSGIRYNCALQTLGTIVCWGDDGYGQLGDGTTNDSIQPVQVVGITDAVAVSTGGFHACALRSTGRVMCWGRNLNGALGNGTRTDSLVPVAVAGITNAVAISAGLAEDETCAVLSTGRIDCWGSGAYGQLGNGTHVSSSTPVQVSGITNAVAVAAGGQDVCAVLATGSIDCWGHNQVGQLGNGTTRNSSVPVSVKPLPGPAKAIAVAGRAYTCTALKSGSVYCWGANKKDQLGNGHQPHGSLVPVQAVGITNAVSISTGPGHACALLSTGTADCWGYDDYGQLGNGPGGGKFRTPNPVIFAPRGSGPGAEGPRAASPSAGPGQCRKGHASRRQQRLARHANYSKVKRSCPGISGSTETSEPV